MSSNINQILLIRCLEIEKEICEKITEKFKGIFYELYSFQHCHFILDFLSKFINEKTFLIYSCLLNNFILTKNKSIGQEYTRIKIKNKNIIVYFLLISSSSLLIQSISEKFLVKIKEYLIYNRKEYWLKKVNDLNEYKSFIPIIGKLGYFYYIQKFEKEIEVNITNKEKENSLIPNYNYLEFSKYLLLIKLIVKFVQLFSFKKTNFNVKLIQNNNLIFKVNNKRTFQFLNKCNICYGNFKNISSTICGHLFCWDCIINYLQQNNYCPKCRKVCLPQQVIFLQNFN